MKRCQTCEEIFEKNSKKCPHCLCEYSKSKVTGFGQDNEAFDRVRVKLDRTKDTRPENRAEFVHLLFSRAMELRYKDPKRSRELFYQVIFHNPDNYEARMKASWLEIRLGKYENIQALLEPLVKSKTSTMDQKQRAYNNLCCGSLFNNPSDYSPAENYALLGIGLDGVGTRKLWENYGTVLKNQNKLVESRVAFNKALDLDPTSDHAQRCIKSLDKLIKQQQQQQQQQQLTIVTTTATVSTTATAKASKRANPGKENGKENGNTYTLTRRSSSFLKVLTSKKNSYEKE